MRLPIRLPTRLPTQPLPTLRRLALTAALLGTGLAQAAGLAITSGSVAGGMAFQADANGQQRSSSASLVETSSRTVLLGAGALEIGHVLAGNGQSTSLNQLWAANASLDATAAANLKFEMGATSVLELSGNGQFGGGTERSNLVLEAGLIVNSTGETTGTPVRLVFSGTADSLVNTTGPLLDVQPTFDLVVRDADSNILASWQGLAVGTSASFSISLDTRVGDSLWISLSHDSTHLLGSAARLAAAGDTLDATALLSGTVLVTAVPEPETYALFLAGLAALCLLQMRRRQR
ncbi:MAG: PEP-CTERM sorting domain-containing protein [Aquabacterium sp.]|nr:PEP-CTERM sorting domain-containing protein [Aquabacterium sp.]